MDCARETDLSWRHSLNSWLLSCSCRWTAEVKVPAPAPSHCPIAHQGELHDKYLVVFGTTNSPDQFVPKAHLAAIMCISFFVCLDMKLPPDPPLAQIGKNTSPSITKSGCNKNSSTNWPHPICSHKTTQEVSYLPHKSFPCLFKHNFSFKRVTLLLDWDILMVTITKW